MAGILTDLQPKVVTFAPTLALSQYFKFYWIGTSGILQSLNIPPTGNLRIFLFYKKVPRLQIFKHDEPEQYLRTAVVGQYYNHLEIRIPDSFEMIGIVVNPNVLHGLFGFDMTDFTHKVLNAADIFGNGINALVDHLSELTSFEEKIAAMEKFFIATLRSVKYNSSIVDHAIHLIRESRGNIRVMDLATSFRCSSRFLEKKFKASIGISPKFFSRIVQFNNALSLIKAHPAITWQDLVVRAGYYDQSHLINAFIEFTGKTPLVYKNTESEFAQFHVIWKQYEQSQAMSHAASLGSPDYLSNSNP